MKIQPLKAIHIHTDHKFIHSYKQFEGLYFSNITVLISSNYNKNDLKENFFHLQNNLEAIDTVIDMCKTADVVILYNLNLIKCKISLKLSKDIQIIWRFFGTELYGRNYIDFISNIDLKKGHTFIKKVKERLKKVRTFNKIEKIINNKEDYDAIFEKAMNRINYMLILSKEEYSFLKESWPNLPNLIKLPHTTLRPSSLKVDLEAKALLNKPLIILGHSRSQFNNHLEIINIIENHPSKVNYNFTLFFNYGGHPYYNKKVLDQTCDKSYFTLINDFLPRDQFIAYYHKATALIINSYRQLAGANIRMALLMGVKVYLNDKNIHKKWLENEGFRVFSIDDFEKDLQNNNLILDVESAIHNCSNFNKFEENYTTHDFQNELYARLIH